MYCNKGILFAEDADDVGCHLVTYDRTGPPWNAYALCGSRKVRRSCIKTVRMWHIDITCVEEIKEGEMDSCLFEWRWSGLVLTSFPGHHSQPSNNLQPQIGQLRYPFLSFQLVVPGSLCNFIYKPAGFVRPLLYSTGTLSGSLIASHLCCPMQSCYDHFFLHVFST